MSILPLLLLVGVASSKFIISHTDDEQLQPIATSSQARRICAELCMSGLGGEACGESCLDISPQGLPVQSLNSVQERRNSTRRDACSVLCSNQLGYPLCQCNSKKVDPNFKVDYIQICSYFCLKHNHQVYGCQPCRVYQQTQEQHGGKEADVFGFSRSSNSNLYEIDWEKWCKEQCSVGNGGAACNCDILPFSAQINNDV